ncbi:biotin--[acetyl-CoA-carboxylase] ligase [Secundilactobacillus folii]|nr:biotin--[acetyl-CoA-carboxylase] ligase [Secundilactobacillus folii]
MTDAEIKLEIERVIRSKITFWHFSTIDSTNAYAKIICRQRQLNTPVIIWSDQQTAGVGRFKRPFYSSQNGGLYLTVIFPHSRPDPQAIGLLTTGLAVATFNAILTVFKITTDLKWVNDLYLNHRKIAGILTEIGAQGALIVGIGINLYQQDFPSALKAIAGNLLTSQPSDEQRTSFLIQLVAEITRLTQTYTNHQHLAIYRRHLSFLGQSIQVQYGNQLFTGIASNINDFGELEMIDDQDHQLHTFNAGEITKIFD